jgi:hypothetical protein
MPREVRSIAFRSSQDGALVTHRLVDRLHPYDVYMVLLKGSSIEVVSNGKFTPEKMNIGPEIRKAVLGIE